MRHAVDDGNCNVYDNDRDNITIDNIGNDDIDTDNKITISDKSPAPIFVS